MFVGEVVFPVLSGGFVDAEGAFKVGFFFAEVPVAEASSVDTGDVFEVCIGIVGEVSILTGGGEEAVPKGVGVGLVESGAVGNVGVALEVVFEGLPSDVAVGVEEVFSFMILGQSVVK